MATGPFLGSAGQQGMMLGQQGTNGMMPGMMGGMMGQPGQPNQPQFNGPNGQNGQPQFNPAYGMGMIPPKINTDRFTSINSIYPFNIMLQIFLLLAVAIQTIAAANSTISSTIVDLAIATPNLSTLVTALKAGGLVKTLEGAGPFTVFAPTDAAFAALPKGVLDNLLQPANKASLDDVLTYHVLGDEVHANKFLDGEMLRTLEGKYVTARVAGSTIFINSAKVTTADVQASNGVIHIIDAVLLPSSAPPRDHQET